MLDFVTGLQILLIVLVAMTIFAGAWIIGVCFDSWGDFIKSLTDKEYNYLSFVFRKGKHIRFITDFPNDLRRECLGKESYYADKENDSAGARKAKMLVRRVLGNDAIVNEYFKGQYFTYKDFLVNGNQKCSDFGNSECSIFGIKTTVLLASAVQ